MALLIGAEENIGICSIIVCYMTDSRDRGISQSAFENPGPYIPIRTATYRVPHTDQHSSHYDPNAFIESKLNDLDLYYYSVQSYNKRFINRVCSCHTEKYRTLVFQHSPRKLGLYEENAVLYFSVWLSHPVNKPLILTEIRKEFFDLLGWEAVRT